MLVEVNSNIHVRTHIHMYYMYIYMCTTGAGGDQHPRQAVRVLRLDVGGHEGSHAVGGETNSKDAAEVA